MLITIVAGTYFYITCCSECSNETSDPPAEEKVIIEELKATAYPFSIKGDSYSFTTNDNYNFNLSSSNILQPLSTEVTNGISGLQAYLGNNKDQILYITGFYTSEEENNSAFPNLGLARANAIKNDLASKGISTTQINTIGQLMNEMIAKDGTYWGPASFSLEKKSETAENELKELYEKINADQRQKVADISKYLDKVEGSKANVVGHTDATGKASTNMRLGLDRANFAKDYLMKNGITEDKIVTSSKGQTQPIESNDTEEGRNRNRRTVITLN